MGSYFDDSSVPHVVCRVGSGHCCFSSCGGTVVCLSHSVRVFYRSRLWLCPIFALLPCDSSQYSFHFLTRTWMGLQAHALRYSFVSNCTGSAFLAREWLLEIVPSESIRSCADSFMTMLSSVRPASCCCGQIDFCDHCALSEVLFDRQFTFMTVYGHFFGHIELNGSNFRTLWS